MRRITRLPLKSQGVSFHDKRDSTLPSLSPFCFVVPEPNSEIWAYVHSGKGLKEHLPNLRYVLQQGVGAVDGSTAKRRDEIYCQVIKNTIENPSEAHSARAWTLLSFCACSFPPSPVLARYLQSYLDANTKVIITMIPNQKLCTVF